MTVLNFKPAVLQKKVFSINIVVDGPDVKIQLNGIEEGKVAGVLVAVAQSLIPTKLDDPSPTRDEETT